MERVTPIPLLALLAPACFSAKEPPHVPHDDTGGAESSGGSTGAAGTDTGTTGASGGTSAASDGHSGTGGDVPGSTSGASQDPDLYAECASDDDCPGGSCMSVAVGSVCTKPCEVSSDCSPPDWYTDPDTVPKCIDWGPDRQCMMGCTFPDPGCPDTMICQATSVGYFCLWPAG